jgi:sugar phosphate isomerase/epimerase
VGLSTASVFPEPPAAAFAAAAELGYDGVELMVGLDRTSQRVDEIAELSRRHRVPVLAVHAPCLLITQRVWGSDPWGKLERSAAAAAQLGAEAVIVHPPFAWQPSYARTFAAGVRGIRDRTGIRLCVENMFPISVAGVSMSSYRPGWRVEGDGRPLYDDITLDISHAASSASDVLAMQADIGAALRHVHLGDGVADPSGRPTRDAHLAPGAGTQPCAEVLRRLASGSFPGAVVLEVNTRSASSAARREALAASLAFARRHLASSGPRPGDDPG